MDDAQKILISVFSPNTLESRRLFHDFFSGITLSAYKMEREILTSPENLNAQREGAYTLFGESHLS